ncbi:MAG: DUF2911 domain-containing protein, partial [Bacteroidota bacterium]
MLTKILFAFTLSTGLYGPVVAQIKFPSPSPKSTLTQVVGNTEIQVIYERPSVRGRIIFGGLEPWNEMWRTGAGHCTKLIFDRAVQVGGQSLSAGAYSLFTIPSPHEWIIILNADTSLYGRNEYNASKDVARFTVQANQSKRFYETMTIDLQLVNYDAEL